jgi:phosphatidylserine/phosphatidylglycerophosphate/cardiolipin synthase-like enzyme
MLKTSFSAWISDYLELRFFDGRLHTKSTLIDQQILIVGSQNFHYSSFGDGGLLEFVTATEAPQAIQDYRRCSINSHTQTRLCGVIPAANNWSLTSPFASARLAAALAVGKIFAE